MQLLLQLTQAAAGAGLVAALIEKSLQTEASKGAHVCTRHIAVDYMGTVAVWADGT